MSQLESMARYIREGLLFGSDVELAFKTPPVQHYETNLGDKVTLLAHYYVHSIWGEGWNWYIIRKDPDGRMFGFVTSPMKSDGEWGYVTEEELKNAGKVHKTSKWELFSVLPRGWKRLEHDPLDGRTEEEIDEYFDRRNKKRP